MKTKLVLATLPPVGSNRLARVVGKKIRKIREKLHLTLAEAAIQAGIPEKVLNQIEDGRYIPNAGLAERLRDWGIRRLDFTGVGPPKTTSDVLTPTDDYVLVKTKLETGLVGQVRAKAKLLGLSQAALVHLAVEWFLQESPAIATLAKARRLVENARIKMALRDPALRDLLEFEVAELIQQGMLREPAEELAVLEIAKHEVKEEGTKEAPYQAWEEL